jgi:sec-independent protein translocase protein TatB
MFDFAWSEILLIGAVALIAIGPKDMPAAIRTVSGMIKKARRMAAEFQTHVDEMVREADMGDVKAALRDIKRMDLPGAFEKAIDPDRTIRDSFADNPLLPPPVPAEPEPPAAPAFIPPSLVPKPVAAAPVDPAEPPAFIPPEAVLRRQRSA